MAPLPLHLRVVDSKLWWWKTVDSEVTNHVRIFVHIIRRATAKEVEARAIIRIIVTSIHRYRCRGKIADGFVDHRPIQILTAMKYVVLDVLKIFWLGGEGGSRNIWTSIRPWCRGGSEKRTPIFGEKNVGSQCERVNHSHWFHFIASSNQ